MDTKTNKWGGPDTGPRPERDPTLPPPRRFSFAVALAPRTAVVTLHGAVDHSGAERLEDVLGDLIDRENQLRRLVVDLRNADGIQPGARCRFEAAASRARERGITFEVNGAQPLSFRPSKPPETPGNRHATEP